MERQRKRLLPCGSSCVQSWGGFFCNRCRGTKTQKQFRAEHPPISEQFRDEPLAASDLTRGQQGKQPAEGGGGEQNLSFTMAAMFVELGKPDSSSIIS